MAALEFALVGPVYLLFLFAAFGVGLVGFYQLALDDAVRNASRLIQINALAATSAGDFEDAICQTFGFLASDCKASLTYNVQTSAATAGFAVLTPVTLPSSGQFIKKFTPAAPSVNVLVQVAYPLPFLLPYIGSLVTTTGTNSVVSMATVRVEPYG